MLFRSPKEMLAKLPPRLARALGGPFELNDSKNTILERLYRTRRPASVFSLFFWAKLERRLCEWISDVVTRPRGVVALPLAKLRALVRRLSAIPGRLAAGRFIGSRSHPSASR